LDVIRCLLVLVRKAGCLPERVSAYWFAASQIVNKIPKKEMVAMTVHTI
jgi:hypothetical protein